LSPFVKQFHGVLISEGRDNLPWVVDGDGGIYRWDKGSSSFVQQPPLPDGDHRAVAIASGGGASGVWALGGTPGSPVAYRFTGSQWIKELYQQNPVMAKSIAVDQISGNAYVIRLDGQGNSLGVWQWQKPPQ
jgi:hypothetical protein